MRLALLELATGRDPVRTRLQAAEPHFGKASEGQKLTKAEETLSLRIGAGLVEGGDEGPT